MKKTMRRVLLVFAAVLLLAISLNVMATEATTLPTLTIEKHALELKDNVRIVYAVPVQEGIDAVKLQVWHEDDYALGTGTPVELSGVQEAINGKQYWVFTYSKLAARQMTDNVYARAYAVVNGETIYSETEKYSILQYAYNKLGKTGTATTDEKLISLLKNLLNYGASAQIYFDGETTRLANANFYQISLVGGALVDGFDKGLYHEGETVTIIAPEKNAEGVEFAYWKNSAGEQIATTVMATITVGASNETYTAVYSNLVHTVIFQDWNGQYLRVQTGILHGGYATAPENPTREGYVFRGWDISFQKVTKNLVVTATYEVGTEGLEYVSTGYGTCYVSGIGTCEERNIIIPKTSPNGDLVTWISANAFSGDSSCNENYKICRQIKSITLSNEIVDIASGVFSDCINLTSVNNMENVEYIGDYAFSGCVNLTSVNNMENVEWIGDYAFSGCVNLKSIDASKVVGMGGYVFKGCSSLADVRFSESLKFISAGTYYGCESLKNIDLSNVTGIGEYAFYNCKSLGSISISVDMIWDYAFAGCTGLKSATINGLKKVELDGMVGELLPNVGDYAFQNCVNLTSVSTPSYSSIVRSAFDGCGNLSRLIFSLDSVTSGYFINKSKNWFYGTGNYMIVCDNGEVGVDGTVYYERSMDDWLSIKIWSEQWGNSLPKCTVICSDGIITADGTKIPNSSSNS